MDSKELRLIKESYASVYTSQIEEVAEETVAEEQLDENPVMDALRKIKGAFKGVSGTSDALKREQRADSNQRRLGQEAMRRAGVGQTERPTGALNNSADLFDIVKGHLMSEGYADTEEAALAIMANMSEEWRNEIVESSCGGGHSKPKKKKKSGY